ncbi:hypothetical protein Tco_1520040, partial [Tanacetum coccineum]
LGEEVWIFLPELIFTFPRKLKTPPRALIRQDIRRSLYGRFSFYDPRSGYQQKDRKPSQNDKTEHGMEKTVKTLKAQS